MLSLQTKELPYPKKQNSHSPVVDKINKALAEIDIGSKEIFVAVSEVKTADYVRSFRAFTDDIKACLKWLQEHRY